MVFKLESLHPFVRPSDESNYMHPLTEQAKPQEKKKCFLVIDQPTAILPVSVPFDI